MSESSLEDALDTADAVISLAEHRKEDVVTLSLSALREIMEYLRELEERADDAYHAGLERDLLT